MLTQDPRKTYTAETPPVSTKRKAYMTSTSRTPFFPRLSEVAGLSLALLAFAAVTGLSGCGIQSAAVASPQTLTIGGVAMGAHTPIENATITLYVAGKTGNGSAATAIGTATTSSTGTFTINRTGTCTDPDQLYLVSTGGDQGGISNPYMVLTDVLGTCSTVTGSTSVTLNEATTIAAAYGVAGFANANGTSVDIGSTATNITGLNNAIQNALNLVGGNGQTHALTVGGNGAVPQALINRLANSLAACINSNGTTGACHNIAVAPPTGATTGTPANAWQIALNWALYPGNNVAAVYANSIAPIFFTPNLTGTTPKDLSVAITYSIGNNAAGTAAAGSPYDIKADASGNIWISGAAGTGLVELDPNGVLLSPATGGFDPGTTLSSATLKSIGLTNTATPTVFVGSSALNVYAYNSGTSALSTFPMPASITVGGVTTPVNQNPFAMAVDNTNNAWYGIYGGSVSNCTLGCYSGEIVNTAGTYAVKTAYPAGSSPVYPAGRGPQYLAITEPGIINTVWAPSQNLNQIDIYYTDYHSAEVVSTTTTGTLPINGVALDPADNAWFVVQGSTARAGTLQEVSTPGTAATQIAGPTGGTNGLFRPRSVAIDSASHMFIADNTGANIVEYDINSGNYFTAGGDGFAPVTSANAKVLLTNTLFNMTIDPSGALWVTNGGTTGPAVQILGIAAPTKTPLSNQNVTFVP